MMKLVLAARLPDELMLHLVDDDRRLAESALHLFHLLHLLTIFVSFQLEYLAIPNDFDKAVLLLLDHLVVPLIVLAHLRLLLLHLNLFHNKLERILKAEIFGLTYLFDKAELVVFAVAKLLANLKVAIDLQICITDV